jgi:hypothetical protein
MTEIELLKQSLDALEHPCTKNDSIGWEDKTRALCAAIRARLEWCQQQPAPVAWVRRSLRD